MSIMLADCNLPRYCTWHRSDDNDDGDNDDDDNDDDDDSDDNDDDLYDSYVIYQTLVIHTVIY